jgi:hypothetical protein
MVATGELCQKGTSREVKRYDQRLKLFDWEKNENERPLLVDVLEAKL